MFVFVALTVAAVNTTTPITRGWWLVAYLVLVGAVSQMLLGPGLIAITEHSGARSPSDKVMHAQLVLWNVGTVTVAVADLASMPAGVLAGSFLLLVALGAFAFLVRRAGSTARRPLPASITGYKLLIVFLVISTIIGAALAGALPPR